MEKLIKLTTKEEIASQLRALIFSGELSDGEEVTQNEVAESLSLSRMPVREAFLLLTEEGLLTRLANRHIAVNGMTFNRASAYFKRLIASDCIALDYIKSFENAEDEISWHKTLLSSSDDALISSICTSALCGYIEYFFLKKRDENRFSVLKRIGDDLLNGNMEEAKKSLNGVYLDMLITQLEVEFA